MNIKKLCVLILIILLPVSLSAVDFGLLLNQYFGYGNSSSEDNAFEYSANLVPRLSFLIGDTGSLFISAGITIEYNNEVNYIPELLRTEYSARFGAWGIRAGRIGYTDPLAFIADGLFDGVQLTYNSTAGKFGIGAWYTGLLYKKNANITMTSEELGLYASAVDYGDFANTYFAPRRFLASIDWEHPSIGELLRLKAAITAQADLRDTNEKYHSQYMTLKAGLPLKKILFELGGSMEMSQATDDAVFNLSLAADTGIVWTLPSSFSSRLAFNVRYAGAKTDDLTAFVPITTKYYGAIFQTKITGLTILSLDYSARLAQSFGTSFNVSYFIRNDIGTYDASPISVEDKQGHFLGAEIFARLVWSPLSDLQFNLGGGAFIPVLGDNWPDTKPVWRVDLSVVLGIF